MQITINHIREMLFNRNSEYRRWNKKDGNNTCDRFVEEIFAFLDTDENTKKAYQQLLYTESSHDNFCRGSLRSDGYYPIKAVNEFIYRDLTRHKGAPESSVTIRELKIGYDYLSEDFSEKLTVNSQIFTEMLTPGNCFDSRPLFSHIQELLNKGEYSLVLAWMTVIAVFPQVSSVTEKKPDYSGMLLKELFSLQEYTEDAPSLHEAYEAFIKEKLSIDDKIEEVILVQNHGLRAMINLRRNTLLRELIEKAESVKILMSEHEVGEEFTKHIRNHSMCYLSSYMPPVLMWRDFCSEYQGKVTLHLSNIPAIHQYTEIRFSNRKYTASFVGIYTYGPTAFDKSPFLILPCNSAYFSVFHTEFEYSWDHSHPYTDTISSPGLNEKNATEYLDSGISCGAKSIDLAFHGGSEWLMVDTKLSVITKMIENKLPCRILINDEDAVHNIIPHMRSANKVYIGLKQNISQWAGFQTKHPDLVRVRVSHIPLLHSIYHIKTDNDSSVHIGYYSYDNTNTLKNYHHVFKQDSRYYGLYINEFEYLWERADDVGDISI